jgi:hypothetical protein
MWLCFFRLPSSHHHLDMNFYYIFLLLLVVLSAYSESPQYGKPPDPFYSTAVAVCPNSSSNPLGVLAPALPQSEVFGSVQSQNMVLPQNEVYRMFFLPQNEVFGSQNVILPHHEVYKIFVLSQNEMFGFPEMVLSLNEVFRTVLLQSEVDIFRNEIFELGIVNCQLANKVKVIINFVLNLEVKGFKFLTSTLVHGGEKLAWTIRLLLESLQHVLKMYTWSMSENQASIRFKCKLIGLLLRQSLFRKHDFAILVYKVYCDRRNLYFWHLNFFSKSTNNLYEHIKEHTEKSTRYQFYGGGKALLFSSDELLPYVSTDLHEQQYQFLQCVTKKQKQSLVLHDGEVLSNVPLDILAPKLTLKIAKELANLHDVYVPSKILLKNVQILLQDHKCQCDEFWSVFKPYKVVSNAERQQTWYQNHKNQRAKYNKHPEYQESHRKSQKNYRTKKNVNFPPNPPSTELCKSIISDFCADTSPEVFEEAGCAICGKLTPICEMEEISEVENINLLKIDGVTRKARCKSSDPVRELRGPVLAPGCSRACPTCAEFLEKKKMPTLALANGLWIGEIPDELQDLTYAEQLLIARVRHNRCIVKVSSGMYKMRANAISFSNPMPKIYNVLPPPIEEMDEVLAFIYTGPCKPTKADFKRTPLLVRRLKVSKALQWLKLNHVDYYDCEISHKNLASYPEEGPPVVVDYHPSSSNKNPESTSVHDMEEEDGTTEGPCPFIVHGLTGEEFSTKTMKTIKAIALKHLTSEGKILAIGHAETPESIYGNPQLFPSMLPWLFPYGLGGIGQTEHKHKLSSMMHKRHLLMYYDKRFQKDPHFPLIAFNHEQMKESTTAGYLTAERKLFHDITDRLMNVNLEVLSDLTKRMTDGERVKPETEEEKLCFKLINDLDHVNGHVPGSITQKKYMRNEIWSLISYYGAPSWFITFSPADNMHPISLYFADTQETFNPTLRPENERYRLIAENPVAGARFFNFIVEMFIKHVLGVNQDHPGLYGKTAAYYATVEQQGRLTLHLHMLLWILNSLSPQEIRDRIMDPNSDFQKRIVEYLESVHVGEFMTGTMDEVKEKVDENMKAKEYRDPTQTLPDAPPEPTDCDCNKCESCENTASWWQNFKNTVDDLILRSNVHKCRTSIPADEKKQKKERRGCINKHGNCKARFPRQTFEKTEVDPKTGALNIKKGERWINTLTPIVTFLLRCNSDVTSLLSGTAIKAIVAYISDYVTKPGLKTYTIFDTIRSVFDKSSELLGGTQKRKDKARSILTKIVNALTAKLEIGAPMASLYLLGNPDHYTNQNFVVFYWKSYVTEVLKAWKQDSNAQSDKVVLLKNTDGEFIGLSTVDDYMYRPYELSDKSLYEWIQIYTRLKRTKTEQKKFQSQKHDDVKPPAVFQTDEEVDTDFESDSDYIESDQASEKEKIQGKYAFLQNHPLYETHQVSISKSKNLVPNFAGGSLPRCDKGDREYYCATMLTLFKPWRHGKNLKEDDQSWDEAFTDYKFTPRQIELMKFFNIRYECNDARDDYSKLLKQTNASDGVFPHWFRADDNDNFDGDNYDDGSDFIVHEEHDADQYTSIGKKGQQRMEQMAEIQKIVTSAGWLDQCPDGPPSIEFAEIEAEKLPPSQWDAAVQEKRQQVLAERNKSLPAQSKNQSGKDPNQNDVQIVDRSYLQKSFKAQSETAQKLIEDVVEKFELTSDQERAFRIIANHAVTPASEQLIMYVGGMAGTGKSQVIKALMEFFKSRNESHRFVVLAPTGTAAALLQGSTYHSILGVPIDGQTALRNETTNNAQVKARLDGVDYNFLDEVSMVSCSDNYKISSQLAKAMNEFDLPYGGMNMIFSGDFAQLPPVFGSPLYSGTVGTQLMSRMTVQGQEAAIGKALWHQVTTVVILRKNMRQKTQSVEDAKLRTALENMRYAACTPEDIKFLKSRIAGRRLEQPKLSTKEFRNVSIITALNAQKDRINELGSVRFAAETGQTLTDFYSIDRFGSPPDAAEKRSRGKKSKTSGKHTSNEISSTLQKVIWDLPPSATNHFPGKLSLCIGMPVIIRNNDATELCITKGQEGHVVGWQAGIGIHGKNVLNTLFIKLDKPAKIVKIDGLPENVVPVTRGSKNVECTFASDLKEYIHRSQVWVLLNFSMTDYTSQGKTRPKNPVDLSNCRSHQSYYTCLSRSATASGTVIVQSFSPRLITCGASGYLRQEFRELELLDEITKLRYEGELPPCVEGNFRNPLIRSYQKWKGTDYVPSLTHPALKWSVTDPLPLLSVVTDAPWQIIDKKKKNDDDDTDITVEGKTTNILPGFVAAKGSVSVKFGKKRKFEEADNLSVSVKKTKATQIVIASNDSSPSGLIWDGDNYSCAYDALFTVLYEIWSTDTKVWTKQFKEINQHHLKSLSVCFKKYMNGQATFETSRDTIRHEIHTKNPEQFPYGKRGTSVGALTSTILAPHDFVAISSPVCTSCEYSEPSIDDRLEFVLHEKEDTPKSTSKWLGSLEHETHEKCPHCFSAMMQPINFKSAPSVLVFEINSRKIKVSKTLKFEQEGETVVLDIRGLIYHGDFHFTSRIIGTDGIVWYHDGMTTGSSCENEGDFDKFSSRKLLRCKGKKLILVVYARV